jgi:hypothetical protein
LADPQEPEGERLDRHCPMWLRRPSGTALGACP